MYETSAEGVFACGDARMGQSLVVTAIAEGRKCARMIDRHLCERNGRAPGPQDPDAHFIEIPAKTAGTITTAHRVVQLPEDAE